MILMLKLKMKQKFFVTQQIIVSNYIGSALLLHHQNLIYIRAFITSFECMININIIYCG